MRMGSSWQQANYTGCAAALDTLGKCKTLSRNRIMADGEEQASSQKVTFFAKTYETELDSTTTSTTCHLLLLLLPTTTRFSAKNFQRYR